MSCAMSKLLFSYSAADLKWAHVKIRGRVNDPIRGIVAAVHCARDLQFSNDKSKLQNSNFRLS